MKTPFLTLALALLFFASAPTQADARSSGSEWSEVLFLMGPSDICINDQNMAVCQVVGQHLMFTIPIMVEAEGYALSSSNCEGEAFYPYSAEELIDLQQSGLIDPELVFDGGLPLKYQLINVASIGGLAVVVLGGILMALLKTFGLGRKKRIKNPVLNEAALAAMCTVARADGRIDAQEAQVVAAVSAQIIGFKPQVQKIIEMLHHAPSKYDEINFSGYSEGLTPKEMRVVMYGALRVAVADGQIAEEEHRVINGLAPALGVSGDEVRRMLKDIADPKHIRKAGMTDPNRYLAFQGRYENADGSFSAAREAGGALGGVWGALKSIKSVTNLLS